MPHAEGPKLAERVTEESPSDVHKRCSPFDRWIARKTLETENAEQPEEVVVPAARPHIEEIDTIVPQILTQMVAKDSGGAERPIPVPQVMVQEVVREAD